MSNFISAAACIVVWLGLFVYLLYIDSKLGKLKDE
ncbi:MAG: CcmD family protein [Armatimonadota bacterium]